MGDVLKPAAGQQMQQPGLIGGAQPQIPGQPAPQQTASGKVLTGDLDSSLASLAENLTMDRGGQVK